MANEAGTLPDNTVGQATTEQNQELNDNMPITANETGTLPDNTGGQATTEENQELNGNMSNTANETGNLSEHKEGQNISLKNEEENASAEGQKNVSELEDRLRHQNTLEQEDESESGSEKLNVYEPANQDQSESRPEIEDGSQKNYTENDPDLSEDVQRYMDILAKAHGVVVALHELVTQYDENQKEIPKEDISSKRAEIQGLYDDMKALESPAFFYALENNGKYEEVVDTRKNNNKLMLKEVLKKVDPPNGKKVPYESESGTVREDVFQQDVAAQSHQDHLQYIEKRKKYDSILDKALAIQKNLNIKLLNAHNSEKRFQRKDFDIYQAALDKLANEASEFVGAYGADPEISKKRKEIKETRKVLTGLFEINSSNMNEKVSKIVDKAQKVLYLQRQLLGLSDIMKKALEENKDITQHRLLALDILKKYKKETGIYTGRNRFKNLFLRHRFTSSKYQRLLNSLKKNHECLTSKDQEDIRDELKLNTDNLQAYNDFYWKLIKKAKKASKKSSFVLGDPHLVNHVPFEELNLNNNVSQPVPETLGKPKSNDMQASESGQNQLANFSKPVNNDQKKTKEGMNGKNQKKEIYPNQKLQQKAMAHVALG
jgi:hypothetical protein